MLKNLKYLKLKVRTTHRTQLFFKKFINNKFFINLVKNNITIIDKNNIMSINYISVYHSEKINSDY